MTAAPADTSSVPGDGQDAQTVPAPDGPPTETGAAGPAAQAEPAADDTQLVTEVAESGDAPEVADVVEDGETAEPAEPDLPPEDVTLDQTRIDPDKSRHPPARNVLLEHGSLVGETADCRWKVSRHVADGGFSSVYQVRPATAETKKRFGAQRRALKCLWGTPAELTQIGGEAGKMAAVDGHDNVLGLVASLRFHQDTEYSRSHYVGLVLELAGEDLYEFRSRVTVSERAWAGIFEQLAAGLEHIHARRIVHGDIKPTNLLRVGPAFKIADFGLSAQLETTRSAGIGLARTIAFWPPESGTQGVLGPDGVRRPPVEGWRASQMGDVWALAVSMHRILTGRHITTGSTAEQQYELVCEGRYAVDDRLSPGWRKLLLECLVHDPDQRVVTTAADLRRRLSELALTEDYLSVPWPAGEPRVCALLDGVQDDRTLMMYLTQESGRVTGTFVPRGDVLLGVARHAHTGVVPALAQQVRDSQRAAVRLAEEQDRLREQAARTGPPDEGRTEMIRRESELDRTRQLSVAVAEVTRQRDQAALDRDRAVRRGDALVVERDRLARQYTDLSRRLDRLEQDRVSGRVAGPPVVVHPQPVPIATYDPPPMAPQPRKSRLGCLVWSILTILVAAMIGTAAASQIIYADPWQIFSDAVDALSRRVGEH